MKMLDLKKLMLVPLICCVSIQQTDAKVIYSAQKTQKLNEEIKNNNGDHQKAFASLLPSWFWNDNIFYDQTKRMPGIAAFVPTGSRYASTNAKVYVGWKYPYGRTNKTTPPRNTPNNKYGIAPLFKYSDYSHTERQLAIRALRDANNAYSLNINGIITKIQNTSGTLHIFTPNPPCTYSNNYNENGGMLCVDYYASLLQKCPKIDIHVYCNSKSVDSLSQRGFNDIDVSELLDEISTFWNKIKNRCNENMYVNENWTINCIERKILQKIEDNWYFYDKEGKECLVTSMTQDEQDDIKSDIITAIRKYIMFAKSTEQAIGEETLTNLMRLILKQRYYNEKNNAAFNRLTMHLITPTW